MGAELQAEQSSASASIAKRSSGSLLRVLGVGFGLAVIVGNTVGAGILRTPGVVAAQLPITWLFLGVWIIGGLYALLGSFAVSELSTMIPKAGGYYVFARRAFGEYPAFIVGWTDWLAQCGTTSAVALVIAEYIDDLVPALAGHDRAWACGVAILFGALQWRGVRWGSTVQNVTTSAKAIAFVIFVIAAFVFAHGAPSPAQPHLLAGGIGLATALILAMQAVIYSYDGWYGVMYFSEEVRDIKHDIPRSMIGGVFALMAIYLLVSAALLHVMPVERIAGEDMAMGSVMRLIFGPSGDAIIRVVMIVSMLSGINAYHLMASRIPFAMSCNGLLPKQVTRVNKGGTPTISLLLSVLAAVLFILGGKIFERVAAILAFFFVADYAMAYLAVFKLRRSEPDTPRPYRAWGYPWTTGLALLGSLSFLVGAIWGDRENSLWALGVLAASYPLYLVTKLVKKVQPAH